MDLADCGSPERLIQAILRHHPNWTPPVPIEALAAAVNILEIRDLDTTSFEGALLTDPDKNQGIILCRPGVPSGRRRFTIGHELGHFLIPTHVGNQKCTQVHLSERGFATAAQRREAEANRFAAGILMPKLWFERDADGLGLPEVGHLRKLAKSYDVSLEAAANRFVELTSTPCAIVFSYGGLVRYARSHVDFPRLAVERKSRLPTGCATCVIPRAGVAGLSDWIELDGTIWLQHEWGRAAPRVLEQVLRQANGHSVTMLLLADDPMEDEDEEEGDLVARWSPRF